MSVLSVATLIVNCILTVLVTWLVKKATTAFDDVRKRTEESEKRQKEENDALKSAMLAILRDRLLQTYRRCAHRGYAAPDERQNFENMYVQYHSLGGNGVMDDVRRKFFALPMEKERTETHD